MAWEYGTYKCGCEGRVQVYGKVSLREDKAERHFENNSCRDCWKKQIKEESENGQDGLPELTGSVKQVQWAKSIRSKNPNSELIKTCTSASQIIDNRFNL